MAGASTIFSMHRSAGGLSLHTRVGLVLCLLTASLLGVLGGLWLQGTRSAIHEEVEAATRVSAQWLKVVLADLEARPADEQGTRLLAVAASVGRVRAHQLEIRDGAGVLRHVSPPPTYKVGRAAPEWFAALVALELPVRHFALGDFRLSLHPDASRAVLDAWDELLALAGWGLLLLLALFAAALVAAAVALEHYGYLPAVRLPAAVRAFAPAADSPTAGRGGACWPSASSRLPSVLSPCSIRRRKGPGGGCSVRWP